MATLRNKTKLAAVSIERPEGSRSSRTQNVLDPELTQDYISQVSEEIEGRVTKKLSKEFSKTESRILGALSKLDEFLLNPQVRICSVAVPGTSRNTNWENQETTGDRSSDDPYPEVGFFSHHSIAQRQKPALTQIKSVLGQWYEVQLVLCPFPEASSNKLAFSRFILLVRLYLFSLTSSTCCGFFLSSLLVRDRCFCDVPVF